MKQGQWYYWKGKAVEDLSREEAIQAVKMLMGQLELDHETLDRVCSRQMAKQANDG